MNDEDIWILNKINVLCKLYNECLLTYLATLAQSSLFCRMEINICISKILQREESFFIYDLLDHLTNLALDILSAIRFNHFVSQNVINIYLVPQLFVVSWGCPSSCAAKLQATMMTHLDTVYLRDVRVLRVVAMSGNILRRASWGHTGPQLGWWSLARAERSLSPGSRRCTYSVGQRREIGAL